MNLRNRFWRNIIIMGIAALVMVAFGATAFAQEEAEVVEAALTAAEVQIAVDATWILVASILVFFMQAGFAMLEAGMIRQTGVVNSLLENFMDAALGGIAFFAVGFAIAAGTSQGGLFGASNFFLSEAMIIEDGAVMYGEGVSTFVIFFFQWAFAATAVTIATGAMAERTHFVGKIIYSVLVTAIVYPVVVHWVWFGGWLSEMTVPFHDFAGSTVVHMTGGIIALIGAMMLGARPGRVFGKPPRPHNLALATLGTFILWFGWYGFNAGSALEMSSNGLVGMVAVNTTLAAAAGAIAAMFFLYMRTGKWDLPFALNGSLAGLVGITAGCAFLSPTVAILVGGIAGILVVLTMDVLEALKIDDAVGAFAVHGVCGAMGTLAIGFFAIPELSLDGSAGLFAGGGVELLVSQVIGIVAVAAWVSVATVVMFGVLKVLGALRMPAVGDAVGIDVYEHGATVWPDVLPHPEDVPAGTGARAAVPGVGD